MLNINCLEMNQLLWYYAEYKLSRNEPAAYGTMLNINCLGMNQLLLYYAEYKLSRNEPAAMVLC